MNANKTQTFAQLLQKLAGIGFLCFALSGCGINPGQLPIEESAAQYKAGLTAIINDPGVVKQAEKMPSLRPDIEKSAGTEEKKAPEFDTPLPPQTAEIEVEPMEMLSSVSVPLQPKESRLYRCHQDGKKMRCDDELSQSQELSLQWEMKNNVVGIQAEIHIQLSKNVSPELSFTNTSTIQSVTSKEGQIHIVLKPSNEAGVFTQRVFIYIEGETYMLDLPYQIR